MSLGSKTTALLAVIISMILTISSLILLHYQEESLRQTIFKSVDSQAITTAHGIGTFIKERLEDTRSIASVLPVEDLVATNHRNLEIHLENLSRTFPRFGNGIYILDKDGILIADAPSHPELYGKSFAYRNYYKRTVQEHRGVMSDTYISKRTNQPVLTFTAPILDKDSGKLIAIVACSVRLYSQDDLLAYRKEKIGNTGYIYVFDQFRRLILHPEDKRMMTLVPEGKNKVLEAALHGFVGAGETINSLGIPMLIAVRPIANSDWYAAVQITQKEAYAPVKNARTSILLMSGISLLLVIIIGAGAIRLVTKPLSQLERVASQITVNLEQIENQEGSALFDSSIDTLKTIRSHDEIGLLATAFLRLTQKLHSALDSLQIAAKNWQLTFNSVHEALVTLDTEGRIVTMNRIAEDWFRVSLTKVHGQNAASVLFDSQEPPKDWPDVALLMQHQKVIWSQEIGRSEGIFQFTITPITTEKKTIGAVLTVNDITELVETEEQVRNMAFYDQLTGLPNRFLLKDRILQALIMAGRAQQRVALMFLDLDHFKRANDRYGHDVGDTLLCQVANTLSRCIRGNDTLSRIGGDEFVIVLHETDSQQINPTIVADRIITALSNPFFINGHELRVGTSIGIAYFPEDGEDDTTLLKHADMAMYQAKSYGGNTYRFFQS